MLITPVSCRTMAFFQGEWPVSDLLVITDVPRLGKVFSRLADERNLQLRVVASLEKGAEEIVSDKPAMIFVQTHLSGFSAEILLKHLKKQLGRRRSRFVLLSPPDQVSEDVRKLYHDHIDATLEDQPLFDALCTLLDARSSKARSGTPVPAEAAAGVSTGSAQPAGEEPALAAGKDIIETMLPVASLPAIDFPSATVGVGVETTLEEQGVVYAPRHQISVYSEFTSSFDSAVSSMPATESAEESLSPHSAAWHHEYPEAIEHESDRKHSKKFTFLIWTLVLVVVVVGITVLQYRSTVPKAVELVPPTVAPVVKPAVPAGVPAPSGYASAPEVLSGSVVKPPVAEPDAHLSDKAVLSAIAENRGGKDKSSSALSIARLKTLPAFIPRSGADKGYSAANPGWERYKGLVTEFKVFREGEFIKAIQVIDRGGQGVPETFMKGVLHQLTKAPLFVQASIEKKDGYEIQRGQIAENLKVVYYRDAKGGRLRAFVVTWQ
jgi:hypothetical protein